MDELICPEIADVPRSAWRIAPANSVAVRFQPERKASFAYIQLRLDR